MFSLTIFLFLVFIIFQTIYIVAPLFTTKVKSLNGREDKKSLSVLIPAYNEELTIGNCINALKNVDYSNFEAIIINDGSKDNTLAVLRESLNLELDPKYLIEGKLKYKKINGVYRSKLDSRIIVIDKLNGGKADSLNAGIDIAKGEVVITLDADSMLEKNSLKYVDLYFEDEKIIATGGTVLIVQGTKMVDGKLKQSFRGNGLIKHQLIHYIHGFYVKKQAQSVFNSIVVISGAFGAFKKDILVKVNGFRTTVGEDIDITLKLYKYINENKLDYRLVYTPEAVCYTECPEDQTNFLKQRFRWQKAFIDCIVEYWGDLFTGLPAKLSLFFALDGFILGTVAAYTTVIMMILSLLSGSNVETLLIIFILSIIPEIIQYVLALYLAKKYGYGYSFIDNIKAFFFLIWDKFTYKLLSVYVNSVGTIKYFFEDDSWGFIERKGEANIVDSIS